MKNIFTFLIGLICSFSLAQDKVYNIRTIAFYNVENLFDTIRDPNTFDEEYTPDGANSWTSSKYNKKLQNISRVISEIGTNDLQKQSPAIIGLAEIENRIVLDDLVRQPLLKSSKYGIVHYDSPDKRGIDVALLYNQKIFKVIDSKAIPLIIYDSQNNNKRVYTRDQLLVSGLLDDELIHIIVNHWPSRSGGEKKSSPYREKAADLNKTIIDSLLAINPDAKIITMGDLNDSPTNKSLKKNLNTSDQPNNTAPNQMYNPFEKLAQKGEGTIGYRDAWDLFDHIIVSGTLLRENKQELKTYTYWKSGVYKKKYFMQQEGQYKGYPLRNNNNEVGFSDHFPVYIYLIKEM
ncbi:MAG: endonuclease/exonuclease/phosphatase family protein [Bacteroidota bacterium]|nr:endonuclease/exonuclease/phosphatase family protein [Bacteroidota bacterium]